MGRSVAVSVWVVVCVGVSVSQRLSYCTKSGIVVFDAGLPPLATKVAYAVLCSDMLCYGVLCYAMVCYGALCCAMVCYGVLDTALTTALLDDLQIAVWE